MSDTTHTTNDGASNMTIANYRTEYRNLMETAKSYGWTAAQFNDRCKVLADWRMKNYRMDKAEAYCAAATEVVQEEIQEAAAA